MFILVRHAHAGDRERRSGAGAERPLSERGRQQARGLIRALTALESPRLVSSPHLRCRQTLEPLADHLGRPVETTPLLGPQADLSALDGVLTDPAWDGAVACTHGEVVRRLIRRWRQGGRVTFSDDLATSHGPRGRDLAEHGSAWIFVDGEAGPAAHYLGPVHADPVLSPH